MISRPVRFVCVKNASSSDVLGRPTWEAWAPELEWLGAWRTPWNFYLGDQLWGLGTLTKRLGSPKGSLKFTLEHSLVEGLQYIQNSSSVQLTGLIILCKQIEKPHCNVPNTSVHHLMKAFPRNVEMSAFHFLHWLIDLTKCFSISTQFNVTGKKDIWIFSTLRGWFQDNKHW